MLGFKVLVTSLSFLSKQISATVDPVSIILVIFCSCLPTTDTMTEPTTDTMAEDQQTSSSSSTGCYVKV